MDKKILRLVFMMAIPVIIENLFQVLLGITDTYFVSKISDEAIAAVGMTNLLMNVLIAFFVALGTGSIALVSRAWGRGDKTSVGLIGQQTLVLSGLLGFALGIIIFMLKTPVLTLPGARGQLYWPVNLHQTQ